jgi:DNA-binding MarR family transcriptional regulator
VLKRLGYVASVRSEDRRTHKVRLTDEGIAALKRASPPWQEAQRSLHAVLGPEVWTDLTRQIRRLAGVEPPARTHYHRDPQQVTSTGAP